MLPHVWKKYFCGCLEMHGMSPEVYARNWKLVVIEE